MPSNSVLIRAIEKNAEEIRRLHDRIGATFEKRDRSPEAWKAACAEFHQRYDQLAFPGGYAGALERILAGDPQTIEAALSFVECRPYFFRSGYMYKDLLRKLKRAPLDSGNARRLELILKAYADYRDRRRRRVGRA
jgi:hypothetical protein